MSFVAELRRLVAAKRNHTTERARTVHSSEPLGGISNVYWFLFLDESPKPETNATEQVQLRIIPRSAKVFKTLGWSGGMAWLASGDQETGERAARGGGQRSAIWAF